MKESDETSYLTYEDYVAAKPVEDDPRRFHQKMSDLAEEDQKKHEEYRCKVLVQRAKAFAESKGDPDEKRTAVWMWDIAEDISHFTIGTNNILGVEQSMTTRGLLSVFQYVPPDEWQKIQDTIVYCMQNKIPLETECRAVRSDGSILFLRIWGQLTYDDEGTPYFIEGTLEDITGQQA